MSYEYWLNHHSLIREGKKLKPATGNNFPEISQLDLEELACGSGFNLFKNLLSFNILHRSTGFYGSRCKQNQSRVAALNTVLLSWWTGKEIAECRVGFCAYFDSRSYGFTALSKHVLPQLGTHTHLWVCITSAHLVPMSWDFLLRRVRPSEQLHTL